MNLDRSIAPITSYRGYGSRFDVDHVSIAKVNSRVLGAVFNSPQTVPLGAVTGYDYKPASFLTNGHLKILTADTPPARPVASDPTTVVFTKKMQPEFERLRDWLAGVVHINRFRPQVTDHPRPTAEDADTSGMPDDHQPAAPEHVEPTVNSASGHTVTPGPTIPHEHPSRDVLPRPPTVRAVDTRNVPRAQSDPAPQLPTPNTPFPLVLRTGARNQRPRGAVPDATHVDVRDLEVVGESYYGRSFAQLFKAAGKPLGGLIWRTARLVAEPTNPYDRHAVAVYVDGLQVGHIPAEIAPEIQPKVIRANRNDQQVTADARIWAAHRDGEWFARVTLDPSDEREPEWRYVEHPSWPGRTSPDGTERLTDAALLHQIHESEAAKLIDGRYFDSYRPDIAQARADGDIDLALILLEKCISASERSAAVLFSRPTVWPTEQAAVIHRSLKQYDLEVAVLERFLEADPTHVGTKGLRKRLARARQLAGASSSDEDQHITNDPASAELFLANPLPTVRITLPNAAEISREKDFLTTIQAVLDRANTPRGEALHTTAIVRELPHRPRGIGLVATYVDRQLVGYVGAYDADTVRELIRHDEFKDRDCEICCRVYMSASPTPHVRITLGPYDDVVEHKDETESAARARQSAADLAELRRDRLARGGAEAEDQRKRLVRGRDFVEWVEPIKELKRATRYDEALQLILECVAAAEYDAARHGCMPPPWYSEQAAILYRRAGAFRDEIAVLERYQQACPSGQSSSAVAERLVKARARLTSRHR